MNVALLPILCCHDGVDATLHQFLTADSLPAELRSALEAHLVKDDAGIVRFANPSMCDQVLQRYGLDAGRAAAEQMTAKIVELINGPTGTETAWFQKEHAYQSLLCDAHRRSKGECTVDGVGLDVVSRSNAVPFFERAFCRLGFEEDATNIAAYLTQLVSRLPWRAGTLHEQTFAQLADFSKQFGAKGLLQFLDSVDASKSGISPRSIARFCANAEDEQVCMDTVAASVNFYGAPRKLGVVPMFALLQDNLVDVNLAGLMLSPTEAAAFVHCIAHSKSLATVAFSGRGEVGSTSMQLKDLVATDCAELHAPEGRNALAVRVSSRRPALRLLGGSISAAVFAAGVCNHRRFGESLRVIDLKRTEFKRRSDSEDGEFSDAVGLKFAAALSNAGARLETVDLRHSRMSQRVAVAICLAAAKCPTLQALDMRGNPLEFGSLVHLLEHHAVGSFTFNGFQHVRPDSLALQLRDLDDNHTMIATACLVAGTYSHLVSIDLDINPLGDRGAVVIAAGLAVCASLSELSLQDCDIGPPGAKALLDVVAPPDDRAVADVAFLSDQAELQAETTFGALGRNLSLGYEHGKVKIKRLDETEYNRSLSLHAPGSVTFDTSRFSNSMLCMSVAINGDVRDELRGFTFEVIGDGQILWASNVIDDVYQIESCEVDVSSVKYLTLVTGCCSVNWGGHTVFINPRITPIHGSDASGTDGRVDSTRSPVSSLTKLDLRNNCIFGMQRWDPVGHAFAYEPSSSISTLLQHVERSNAELTILTTEGSCFSAGATDSLFLSACSALDSKAGHEMLERVLSSGRGEDLNQQLDEHRVLALLGLCLEHPAYAASRDIISSLEGDTETLSVCQQEWQDVAGVAHGVKVQDKRAESVNLPVLQVHPILLEAVAEDTALHIAVRSKRFDVATQLAARGANAQVCNAFDQSVFDLVAAMQYRGVVIPEDLLVVLGDEEGSEEEDSEEEESGSDDDSLGAEAVDGAINCPGSHGLRADSVGKKDSISCDICRSAMTAGDATRACRVCDFDVCEACWSDM